MPAFVVIEVDTGRILRTVWGPEKDKLLQAGPGEGVLDAPPGITDETHYIAGGEAVPYPPRPGPWAEFDFDTAEWFDPRTQAQIDAETMAALRETRDQLLAASDWSQLPDAPCDRAAWAAYRQALRDLPQTADPMAPIYPEQPRRTS